MRWEKKTKKKHVNAIVYVKDETDRYFQQIRKKGIK